MYKINQLNNTQQFSILISYNFISLNIMHNTIQTFDSRENSR